MNSIAAKPSDVERIYEALTGRTVKNPIPDGEWYPRVDAVRELVDGSSLLDETDRHPDPDCEAIRWSICEGQVYQGIGRPRGVWREAENPCDIFFLGNVVLPLPIDGLIHAEWLKPTLKDEMIAEGGVLFENTEHGKAAYSDRWGTGGAVRTAEWRAKGGTNLARCVTDPYYIYSIGKCDTPCHKCPTLRRVDYLRDGAGNDQAVAWFDPALCPDIAAFLTAKLGPLAWLRVEDAPTVDPIEPIVTAAVTSLPATLPPPAISMMEAGEVVLTTPRDAVDVYQSLWKTGAAARKAFQRAGMGATFVPEGLRRVDYRRDGRGQQPAVAWFPPARDPDEVKALLVAKLGLLVRWDVAVEPQLDPEPPRSPEPMINVPAPASILALSVGENNAPLME